MEGGGRHCAQEEEGLLETLSTTTLLTREAPQHYFKS